MYLIGFEGDSCEINIDECASEPCQNGATCRDFVAHYMCNCAPGWSGKYILWYKLCLLFELKFPWLDSELVHVISGESVYLESPK